jgi:hypothetical protein
MAYRANCKKRSKERNESSNDCSVGSLVPTPFWQLKLLDFIAANSTYSSPTILQAAPPMKKL